MASKRARYGTGSVFRRSSDGRWIARLSLGKDDDGRRIRPQRSGRTRAEARAALRELRAEYAKSTNRQVDKATSR